MECKTPVVFISSNAWAVAAAVALQSLLDHYAGSEQLKIYIFSADMSDENAARFLSYADEKVKVEVVKADITPYSRFAVAGYYVPPLSFLKCSLSRLLPQYDRILYLDIDTLIQKDISELLHLDIDGYYVAGVMDMTAMETLKWHRRLGRMRYLNTGVMLLNAKRIRDEGLEEKALAAKNAHPEYMCMDQDPLNDVFDDEVKYLPPVWNLMTYNLWLNPATQYSLEQINLFYDIDYDSYEALEQGAAILHLTNEFKPWEYEGAYMGEKWMETFRRSKFADVPLQQKPIPQVAPVTSHESGGTHIRSRLGPFEKDWTMTLTELRFLGFPLVRKIKGGWYTTYEILQVPVIRREWSQLEEKTFLFDVCVCRRPRQLVSAQQTGGSFGQSYTDIWGQIKLLENMRRRRGPQSLGEKNEDII